MRPLRLRLGEGLPAEALERILSGDYILVGADEEAELSLSALKGRERASGPPGPEPSAAPVLSLREAEILEYLAEGWSNEEIASVLGIGRRTVRFHLEGLYAKLRVSRRGEAVAEAFRRGLLRFDF